MNNFTSITTRKKLRQDLREHRRTLSKSQQNLAANQLVKKLRNHPVFLRSKRIAFYMAEDGEINPRYLMNAAEKMGKQCYLPILRPLRHNALWFGRYRQGDRLWINYFGLEEPSFINRFLPAWGLDLVLMPLVGFDRQGNRLGMGGGFYDRTFAFKHNAQRQSRAPVLIGLAHHCQETSDLSRESWDVPFDYVVTDKEIIKAN